MTTTGRPPRAPSRSYISGGPGRVGVFESIKRHWVLVAAPALAFMLLAVLVAWVRTPVYTAEARLNVGGIELPNSSVSNFVTGTQQLAATYSRLVTANDVVLGTIQQSKLPPGKVWGSLSASPIPESSVFRIDATASSPGDAIAIANSASQVLITYVRSRSNDTADARHLLAQVRKAAEDVQSATSVGQREEAQLRLETARTLYQEQQAAAQSSGLVQVLNPAATASSDRSSVLQRLAFVGLLGGLAVGTALATLYANGTFRRRRRGRPDGRFDPTGSENEDPPSDLYQG